MGVDYEQLNEDVESGALDQDEADDLAKQAEEDEDRKMDEWETWLEAISKDNDPDEVERMIEERQNRQPR